MVGPQNCNKESRTGVTKPRAINAQFMRISRERLMFAEMHCIPKSINGWLMLRNHSFNYLREIFFVSGFIRSRTAVLRA
jgi:hypothetical protein